MKNLVLTNENGNNHHHQNNWVNVSMDCDCFIEEYAFMDFDNHSMCRNRRKLIVNLRYFNTFSQEEINHIYVHLYKRYYIDINNRHFSVKPSDTNLSEFMINLEVNGVISKKVLPETMVKIDNFIIDLKKRTVYIYENNLLISQEFQNKGGVILTFDYTELFKYINNCNGKTLILCYNTNHLPTLNENVIINNFNEDDKFERVFIFNIADRMMRGEVEFNIDTKMTWLIDNEPHNVFLTRCRDLMNILKISKNISINFFITYLFDIFHYSTCNNSTIIEPIINALYIPPEYRRKFLNLKTEYSRLRILINKISGSVITEKEILKKQKKNSINIENFTHYQMTNLNQSCSICLNTLEEPVILLRCSHLFCSRCLNEITREICPLCRKQFKTNEIYNCSTVIAKFGILMEEILNLCDDDHKQNILIYINGHVSISKKIATTLRYIGKHRGKVITTDTENLESIDNINTAIFIGRDSLKLRKHLSKGTPKIYIISW